MTPANPQLPSEQVVMAVASGDRFTIHETYESARKVLQQALAEDKLIEVVSDGTPYAVNPHAVTYLLQRPAHDE